MLGIKGKKTWDKRSLHSEKSPGRKSGEIYLTPGYFVATFPVSHTQFGTGVKMAKLLIGKGLITEAEFMQKLSAEWSCERR